MICIQYRQRAASAEIASYGRKCAPLTQSQHSEHIHAILRRTCAFVGSAVFENVSQPCLCGCAVPQTPPPDRQDLISIR